MWHVWKAMIALVVCVLLIHPARVAGQAVDPIEVVRNYIATANTGDFDKTFAFYADGAVVKNPLGLFVGKEQVSGWLQQDVKTTRATPEDFQVVNGNTVINTGMVSLARFEQLGVGQTKYRAEYIIENGKIRFFSPTPILTPEQQEKVRAAAPAVAPPTIDPIEVVRNYITTVNTGDFDKAFAFYADGAVVKNPLGLFVGKEQIGSWLQQDVTTTRATPQDFQVVNGNTVINTGVVSLARFEQLGVGPVQYRSEYLIEGDKIKYFSPTTILTPEQQEKVRAAGAGSAAPNVPAALPQTGSNGSEYVWMVGVALLVGSLGLMLHRRMRRM